MKGRILLAVIVFICANSGVLCQDCPYTPTTVSGRYAPMGKLCKNQLIFQEHFDSLNTELWERQNAMDGFGNGEFQWYTDSPRNSYTKNGILFIRPTLTSDVIDDVFNCNITLPSGYNHVCSRDHPVPVIQSALIKSQNAFSFKYGRVEVRAKAPTGDWLWPAIWFMPKVSTYGGWPRSGEIDLMETRGNENLYDGSGQNVGVEQFGSTLHFGNEGWSAYLTAHFSQFSPRGNGWNKGFHSYKMEWAPTHFSYTVDNTYMGVVATEDGYFKRGGFSGENIWANGGIDAPFDQEFYFRINLAVGGTNGYFPNDGNQGGKPWRNNSPTPIADFWNGRNQWLPTWKLNVNNSYDASLQIDFIKVYAY